MKKTFFALALLITGLHAFAYSPGGVMVCGKRPTLYSFYEGSNHLLNNIKVWKDDKKLSREEYLLKALTKLKQQSPRIFNGVFPIVQKLQVLEVGFITHSALPEIPFVDEGCTYQEIAERQYDNKFLFVDMTLYPRLSPMGQAGVIIQEAFFGFMIDAELKKLDPDFARKFVAKLFSDDPLNPKLNTDGMTPEQKKNATLSVCTGKLEALSKGVDLFVQTVQLCKAEKDKGSQQAYSDIRNFILETISECRTDCLWDEAVKTCEGFETTINMKNACL